MKTKKLQTVLLSTAGVAIVLGLVVLVNMFFAAFKARVDLTSEKAFTLSKGTRAILARLDAPVTLRLYATRGSTAMPPGLKNYARRVEDLLHEYRGAAGGKVKIEKYDPQPDTDAFDLARMDGVRGQTMNLTDTIYLGLAIKFLDQSVAIPFLSPSRERLLEYDITRAISEVMATEKPVIGLMSALPVRGGEGNPMMMMQMGRQPEPPWAFFSELQRTFEVVDVPVDAEEVPANVKVLLVIHPENIAEKGEYALDQFVLRGGKLLAFVDPLSITSSMLNPQAQRMGMATSSSSLKKLFGAWGVEFSDTQTVADLNFKAQMRRRGRPEVMPAVLLMNELGFAKNEILTDNLSSLVLPFAGVFSGTPAEGVTRTVLLHSTNESELVDPMRAQMAGDDIVNKFKASNQEHALAVRLQGKFKTAFPDGKPAEKKEGEDAEKTDDAAKKDAKADGKAKKDEAKPDSLKVSREEGVVVLVGDADMLYDQFTVQVQDILGQRVMMPVNGNLNFALNMVDWAAGDSNLMRIRGRGDSVRQFTRINQMEAEAEREYQDRIQALENDLQETERRLGELQAAKGDGDQRMILSPEQQQEIDRFEREKEKASRELRQVRKDLRREINKLENWIKAINIAGMPLLMIGIGIAVGMMRKMRTKAQ